MSKKEIAEPPSQSSVTVKGSDLVVSTMDDLWLEDAGAGNDVGAGDLTIPFLTILQSNSPQVSKANSKYVKGAEAGMIMNTLTGITYAGDEGVRFVNCGYQKMMVRWKPRDSGGGFVCNYMEGDPYLQRLSKNAKNQYVDAESGDIIIDTAYHFGLHLIEEDFPQITVVSMYSTQLKKSRNWNTMMKGIIRKHPKTGQVYNPPRYGYVYRLKTVGEQKDNYAWFGWSISVEGELKDPNIYMMAKNLAKDVTVGGVRVTAPPKDFEAPHEDVPF